MKFSEIQPYVRYAHYLPVDKISNYGQSIPYDNRFFYMHKGEGEIETEQGTFYVSEGDVVIIPSGMMYRLCIPEKKAVYIALNFDYSQEHTGENIPIPPATPETYNPTLKLEDVEFKDEENFNGIIYLKEMQGVSGKLIKLEQEFSHKLLYFEDIISNLFSQVLFECARNIHNEKHNSNSEISKIVIEYINENFNKPLTNQYIGKEFNLHPNYISELVKAATGMPMHQYIIIKRVSNSVDMLNTKRYTINEIAKRCGFCDIYHYSKTFKRIMGVSPSMFL